MAGFQHQDFSGRRIQVYHEVPFAAAAQLFAIVDANGDGHPDIFSTFAGGGGSPEQHCVASVTRGEAVS